MKKIVIAILFIILLFFIFFHLSSEKENIYTNKNVAKLNVKINEKYVGYNPDMSSYKNMRAFDHQFVGMHPKEFLSAIEDKDFKGIVFFGFKQCHFCQEATSYLNEAAKESDIKIYYIDCYNKDFPLKDYYEEIKNKMSTCLNGDDLSTPLVVSVKNSKVTKCHVGLSKKEDWKQNDPSKNAIDELKNIYFDIFKELQ